MATITQTVTQRHREMEETEAINTRNRKDSRCRLEITRVLRETVLQIELRLQETRNLQETQCRTGVRSRLEV